MRDYVDDDEEHPCMQKKCSASQSQTNVREDNPRSYSKMITPQLNSPKI